MDNFLPPEILDLIFHNLGKLRDINNVCLVCKKFNQVIKIGKQRDILILKDKYISLNKANRLPEKSNEEIIFDHLRPFIEKVVTYLYDNGFFRNYLNN